MAPRLLIIHTLDWPNAARLAMAFAAADCQVHVLCRAGHPVRAVSSVQRVYRLNLFAPLRSIRDAIIEADPHFIIPCDDAAAAHLHHLYRQERRSSAGAVTPIAALIDHSLGDCAAHEQLATRSRLGPIAHAAGVTLPQTDVILSLDELRQWTAREGFPAVVKTDRSWGGEGVAIIRSPRQAEQAYGAMSRLPSLVRVLKRILINGDPNLYVRRFVDPFNTITVQKFIHGRIANASLACWKGVAIGSLGVEVVAAYGATGAGTVVHPVENPQMLQAAERIVGLLGISGFCGFDFILEQETERAYLIEINPRATQINHLVLGAGHDLPGALRARIAAEPQREACPVTDLETIALFPQEWERDHNSVFLTNAYHDIPREEPAFVQACLKSPSSRRRPERFANLRN